jgi:hypothetical protein
MTPDVIASQCSDILAEKIALRQSTVCTFEEREEHGFSPAQITQHITKHMLHANVMLANQARQLLGINNILYRNITSSATEEGIIDSKQIKDFLAVSGQLTTLYRTDGNKLLFGRRSQGTE